MFMGGYLGRDKEERKVGLIVEAQKSRGRVLSVGWTRWLVGRRVAVIAGLGTTLAPKTHNTTTQVRSY